LGAWEPKKSTGSLGALKLPKAVAACTPRTRPCARQGRRVMWPLGPSDYDDRPVRAAAAAQRVSSFGTTEDSIVWPSIGHATLSSSFPPKRSTEKREEPSRDKKTRKEKRRAYGTPDSHVVPHRSTDEACSGLTAQFGRDTVRFTEYGRRRMHTAICLYMKCVYWIVKRQSRLMMVPHWRTQGLAGPPRREPRELIEEARRTAYY
jgi:hypothetical protein